MKNKILFTVSILIVLIMAGCTSEPNYGPSQLVATWQRIYLTDTIYLSITDNSNYTFGLVHSGLKTQTVKGTYTYTDKQVTIYDVSGTGANCPSVPGSYNYFVYADTLILTSPTDNCVRSNGSQRKDVIAGSWIRH